MELEGYCTICYIPITFDDAIFTICCQILCYDCWDFHECEECFSYSDSDSTYEPTESSESTEEDDPAEMAVDTDSEQ